jgi:hypothetical protein
MTVKFIAGALIVVAGVLLGNSINAVYAERISVLERFHEFLIFCESEIGYYRTEFATIIDKFTQNENKYDKYIFDEKYNGLYMTKETKSLIAGFIGEIGKLDSDTQKGFFANTEHKLLSALEKAKKDKEIKGKTWKKLAPIAAIGIFILLL